MRKHFREPLLTTAGRGLPNAPGIAGEIDRLICSCMTERGGFNSAFFSCFGIEIGRGFKIKKGWRDRLRRFGDVREIKVRVAEYEATQPKSLFVPVEQEMLIEEAAQKMGLGFPEW